MKKDSLVLILNSTIKERDRVKKEVIAKRDSFEKRSIQRVNDWLKEQGLGYWKAPDYGIDTMHSIEFTDQEKSFGHTIIYYTTGSRRNRSIPEINHGSMGNFLLGSSEHNLLVQRGLFADVMADNYEQFENLLEELEDEKKSIMEPLNALNGVITDMMLELQIIVRKETEEEFRKTGILRSPLSELSIEVTGFSKTGRTADSIVTYSKDGELTGPAYNGNRVSNHMWIVNQIINDRVEVLIEDHKKE